MNVRVRGPLVGSVLFLIYALSSGRSVGWEDSAFLQLAHATLGVPHGPGFPLYVLLGRVWVLPFGDAVAWGSNLFSAVAMAAAGVILLEIMILLAGAESGNNSQRDPWVLAGGIGLVVGWGTLEIIWQQAVRTEVYALALFLTLVTAYLSLCADRTWKEQPEGGQRLGIAACFTWGLGMAVHPLVVGAAATPWLLTLWPRVWRSPRILPAAFAAAALPGLLYLYPVLRGRMEGVWSWGAFGDAAAALDYYFRRSAWATVTTAGGYLMENLRGWLFALRNIWPLAITVPGLLTMIWLRKSWALPSSTFAVIGLVIWAAPFATDNLDLWGYFLPAGTFLTLAAGVFVMKAVSLLRRQMPGLSPSSRQAIGFFSICLLLGWPTVSVLSSGAAMSHAEGAGEFLGVLAGSLPPDALVLVADDNLLGPLEYARRVEGIRPDLQVVALGALRFPFYRDQLRSVLPCVPEELWRSPRTWSEEEWTHATGSWVASLPGDGVRPVFTQYDALPGLSAERLFPAGFLYAWSPRATPLPAQAALDFWLGAPRLVWHDPVGRAVFARWQFNFGAFAGARGLPRMGWEAVNGALATTPDNPEIFFSLGRALERGGQVEEAAAMYRTAVELAPYRARYEEAKDRIEALLADRS